MMMRWNLKAMGIAFRALTAFAIIASATAAQPTPEEMADARAKADANQQYIQALMDQARANAQARAAIAPTATPAQVAAQEGAQVQAKQVEFQSHFAPWLTKDVPMPDGKPLTSEALQAQSGTDLMSLSASFSQAYVKRDSDVNAFVKNNPWGLQAGGTDANGGLYIIGGFDSLGAPVVKSSFNLESAQTVSAQRLWRAEAVASVSMARMQSSANGTAATRRPTIKSFGSAGSTSNS